jgi:hypothetical protein
MRWAIPRPCPAVAKVREVVKGFVPTKSDPIKIALIVIFVMGNIPRHRRFMQYAVEKFGLVPLKSREEAMSMKYFKYLELTDKQRDKLNKILQKKIKALQAEIKATEEGIAALAKKPKPK